jgi:hypothetical protein
MCRSRLTIICCGVLASFSLSVQSAERAPAVETPAAKAKQAAAWAEIHTWPNLWEGSWQGISPIIEEFATPPSYTPQAQKLIDAFKPVEDSTFANCHPQGMPFVMNIVAMPMKDANTARIPIQLTWANRLVIGKATHWWSVPSVCFLTPLSR